MNRKISLNQLLFDKGVDLRETSFTEIEKPQGLAESISAETDQVDYPFTEERLFEEAINRLEQEEYIEAIGFLQPILLIDNNNTKVMINLALCYFELHFIDKAEVTLQRVLEIEPDNTIAKKNLQILKENRLDG